MISPTIVVICYNRPQALIRLLNSLSTSYYPDSEYPRLVLSIDYSGSDEVLIIAKKFEWPGEKRVIAYASNQGLRDHVLQCGDLAEEYEAIIVLEDDLLVSDGFYEFALASLEYYADAELIAGISLYTYEYEEISLFRYDPLINEFDTELIQIASSWGQIWTRAQWRSFRQWYNDQKDWVSDNRLPSIVNCWPNTSWKKFFIKYMMINNLYMVFPKTGLSSNSGVSGEHAPQDETYRISRLQRGQKEFSFQPLNQEAELRDTFFQLSQDYFKTRLPELSEFDFDVDLLGSKSHENLIREFILTTKSCSNPILQYGLFVKPVENNVLMQLEGEGISLSKTSEVRSWSFPYELSPYFYPIHPRPLEFYIPSWKQQLLTKLSIEKNTNFIKRLLFIILRKYLVK